MELTGVGAPITTEQLGAIRLLLFGSSPEASDVERWDKQGFTFSKNPKIPWGLTQLQGGPCGILAPVQAWLIRQLVFTPPEQKCYDGDECPLRPSTDQVNEALLRALTIILERAAKGGTGLVVVTGPPDGMCMQRLKDSTETIEFLRAQFHQFRSSTGVLLFVYSVLLSRGIDVIRGDMDDNTLPLVARFGHCTQELVNLMLTGQAVTNIFDGRKVLDGDPDDPRAYALRGVPEQGEIGFLSLLEAMNYGAVGDFYKSPKTPVWVVGSSSHYTILFAVDRRIGAINEDDKQMAVARRAFNDLDPHGNNFISRSQLPTLLRKLGIDQNTDVVANVVDPDRLGVCLWPAIEAALQEYAPMLRSPAKAAPTTWICPACTFINQATQKTCDICSTAAPPAAPVVVAKKDAKAGHPKNFTVYHFNGIEGKKDVAECSRCRVTLLPSDIPTMEQSSLAKRGLREVIQTRWTSAMVDFPAGKDPKII